MRAAAAATAGSRPKGRSMPAAAPRFRKFLRRSGTASCRSISPRPAAISTRRWRWAPCCAKGPSVARVARTVVSECGFEAQNSDVCLKLKQSGRELHGDLWTRSAMCNSACPYLILGATTPRDRARRACWRCIRRKWWCISAAAGCRRRQMRAAATARGLERADRMLMHYIVKMGAEPGLLALARTDQIRGHACPDPRGDRALRHRPARIGGDAVDVRKQRPQHGAQDRRAEE